MPRLTAHEKIEFGRVPEHVRERVDQRELDYWLSLSGPSRIDRYLVAKGEHHSAHAWENGFLSNHLGMGAAEGKGGVLIMAIKNAWDKSPSAQDEREAINQALRDAPKVCSECKIEQHGSNVPSFCGIYICLTCWWENDPNGAKKFKIPKPTAGPTSTELARNINKF